MGCGYLLGRDSDIWGEPSPDLIALRSRQNEGLYSSCVAEPMVQTWHRLVGRYLKVCSLVSLKASAQLRPVETRRSRLHGQHRALLSGRSAASCVSRGDEPGLAVAGCSHLCSVFRLQYADPLGYGSCFHCRVHSLPWFVHQGQINRHFAATTASVLELLWYDSMLTFSRFAAVQVVFIGTSGNASGS